MSQSPFDRQPSNPYDAPQSAPQPMNDPQAASRGRPATATVFGILNIVFGVMGVFGLVFTVVMWSLPANPRMPNPALDLMRESDLYRTFTIIATGLGTVATIALIAAGVGLLRLKPWGRTLSIAYAVYGIISVIVGAVVNYFVLVAPLVENAVNMPAGPEKAGAVGGAIGGVFGTCFGLIYPVVLLIFMLRLKLPVEAEV